MEENELSCILYANTSRALPRQHQPCAPAPSLQGAALLAMPFLLPQETLICIVSYLGLKAATTMLLQKSKSAAERTPSMASHTSSRRYLKEQMKVYSVLNSVEGEEQTSHRFCTFAGGRTGQKASKAERSDL
jgi:hypothetical protein